MSANSSTERQQSLSPDTQPKLEKELADSVAQHALNGSGLEIDDGIEVSENLDELGEPIAILTIQGATSDSVKDYLGKTSKTLLSAPKEVELAKQIEAGLLAGEKLDLEADQLDKELQVDLKLLIEQGEAAYETMVTSNLLLVPKLASYYSRSGMSQSDLIQEGNLGLMHAVEMFDYTKGFKFSTYARAWIKQAIQRATRQQGRTIYIPQHVYADHWLIHGAQKNLTHELGRHPTPEEIAAETSLSLETIAEDSILFQNPLSLNQPINDEGGASELQEVLVAGNESSVITVADEALRTMLKFDLAKVLDGLSDQEANIIRLGHGLSGQEPKTYAEISRILGISQDKITRIHHVAQRKIAKVTHLQEYMR